MFAVRVLTKVIIVRINVDKDVDDAISAILKQDD